MANVSSKLIEVCVFAIVHDQPSYLLLRRSKDEKVYPNLWQMVSGSIEGAETAAEAARRELLEETGFQPTAFWVAPHVSSFYDPKSDSVNLCPLFAAQVDPGEIPRLSEEHCEYQWYTYIEAHKLLVWPGQKEGLRIVHEQIISGAEAAQRTRIR